MEEKKNDEKAAISKEKENGQDTPISTPSDGTPSSTTNEADSNGIKERSPELSDDEYITDSSVDSILEEQKEREVKEKEQEEATLPFCPRQRRRRKHSRSME